MMMSLLYHTESKFSVQMLRIPETEFIGRILAHHPEIGEKAAKLFYVALWKLLIDARSKERKTKVGNSFHVKWLPVVRRRQSSRSNSCLNPQ